MISLKKKLMTDQAEKLREMFAKPRIITIASGKGGVGKSNIAVNLGLALADLSKKVIILDADLGLSNINVLFGILPKYNLFHVISGQIFLADAIINLPDEGVEIIAGASGFSQLTSLSEEKRKDFIKQINSLNNRNYIIIDASPGISDNVISFALSADDVIVVTTPEPTAIADAYGIIKALVQHSHAKIQLKILINRANSFAEAKNIAEKIITTSHQFLNVVIQRLGAILEDTSVSKSVFMQTPFIRAFPQSKASFCIRHIAEIIDGTKVKKPKGLVRLVKSFFKPIPI